MMLGRRLAPWLLGAAILTACSSFSSSSDFVITTDADTSIRGELEPIHSETIRFVVLGDRTGGHRPGVFGDAVAKANEQEPDFILTVGDLIEGYTDDLEILNQQWDEFDRIIAEAEAPVLFTPGNHDISNRPSQELWAERVGPAFYHLRYGPLLILVLNTEDPPVALPADILTKALALENAMLRDPVATQARILDAVRGRPASPKLPGSVNISKRQVDYAEETLSQHQDAEHVIVVLHKPAWLYESTEWNDIEGLLEGRPHTVIAGHEHYFEQDIRNGSPYIITGTSGGVWLRDGPGRLDHILVYEYGDQALDLRSIELDWQTTEP